MKQCGTCVWMHQPADVVEYGECHGVPPQLAGDLFDETCREWIPRFYWPRVFSSSVGCGQHKDPARPVRLSNLPRSTATEGKEK